MPASPDVIAEIRHQKDFEQALNENPAIDYRVNPAAHSCR